MNCYIFQRLTGNDFGMLIIFDFYIRHVLLAFNISPAKTEFVLSLFSLKDNFV